jgi:diguanylate cyclase (GGDEF)-like protein
VKLRGRRRQPWPAWAFTLLLAVAATATWSPVAALHVYPAPWRIPWLLLAAGFAAGQLVAFRFEFSGESHVTTLSEVPLLVGLVFTSTEHLLLAALLGTLVGSLWDREAPIKGVFNISVRLLEVVVAAACFHAIVGSRSPVSVVGWLAPFVAIPAANLLSAGCVHLVIALSIGRFEHTKVKALISEWSGFLALNIAVGCVAVAGLWTQPLTIIPLLGIGAALRWGFMAHNRLVGENNNLEQVYLFSRALSELDDAEQVIGAVLVEARKRLECGLAEFSLHGPAGETRYTLTAEGPVLAAHGLGSHPMRALVVTAGAGVLAQATPSGHRLKEALRQFDVIDAVAAPVFGDDGMVGLLICANRLGEHLTFEESDRAVLEALATATSMALRSSLLLDRLRAEVASKDYQSLHDALTGLGNRSLFTEHVATALARSPTDSVVAVMLMDLDRFKEVNDTLGHHTGDVMLQQIAAQLVRAIGDHGSVARLGGDEFAFVVPAASLAEVVEVASDVLAGGQATVVVEGLRLEVRASLGVAIDYDRGADRSTLLRRADVAMYRAKSLGTGIEYYQPESDPHSTKRLVLASEMRLAMHTPALEVHYQPKADLRSGRVSGVEALLRWTHPIYGTINPDEFIPLAEQSGLIRPLTLWVLESGLSQLAQWNREGLDLTLAVNLSARSVFDAELADDLGRLLEVNQVAPEALTLEITESSIFGDRPPGHSVIEHLADLGVRLSIDDFGTGYSSLSRLERLPVHEVKIDKSFVTAMLDNDGHDAIVRSTIDLARNLNLAVVAEGVEDALTWDRLGALGCDTGQGFYLSRPRRADDLGGWLGRRLRRERASAARAAS